MSTKGTMSVEERMTRRVLIEFIIGEDDPDVRGNLAELLAFGEVEVDAEAPYLVGTTTMRLLDETRRFDKESSGTNIFRYSF